MPRALRPNARHWRMFGWRCERQARHCACCGGSEADRGVSGEHEFEFRLCAGHAESRTGKARKSTFRGAALGRSFKEEASTLARTKGNVMDSTRRLRDIKGGCQRSEATFGRLRGDVLQEERKLQHVRRNLSQTETNLRDMEAQGKTTSIGIEQERQTAV